MTLSTLRAARTNLCTHQASSSPVCPGASGGIVGWRWLSHAMSRARTVSGQYLSSTISTSRTASRTTGVARQQVLDLLALEDDVFQWCLSAQSDLTTLQRSNRGKSVHLLRDLNATADLPPHCPLFVLQLLDLTQRCGLNPREGDVYPWRQRLLIALNCTPPGTQTRLHSSFQTLGSRPALSLTFSRLLSLFWAGANLATCRLCIRLRMCVKLWSKNTAFWIQ